MVLFLLLLSIVSVSVATYAPHVQVLQSTGSNLVHRHSQQKDGAVLDRTATQALVARMVGGIEIQQTNIQSLPPLPSRDILSRPSVVLTVVIEGEYASVNALDLPGDVAADYLLSDVDLPAVDLEVVSSAALSKGVTTKTSKSFVVSMSHTKRQETSDFNVACNTPAVIQARGTDAAVVARLASLFNGASTLSGNTILLLPLDKTAKSSNNNNNNIALDVGRALDQQFLHELDLLTSTSLVADRVCDSTTASSNIIASLTTLSPLSISQRWDSSTTSTMATMITKVMMKVWSNVCHKEEEKTHQQQRMVSIVVSGVPPAHQFVTVLVNDVNATNGRRLLAAPAPAAQPSEGGDKYYTQSEINAYQIRLGGGFIFGVALLLAVCLFCGSTMDYTNDPLLFGQISFKNHLD